MNKDNKNKENIEPNEKIKEDIPKEEIKETKEELKEVEEEKEHNDKEKKHVNVESDTLICPSCGASIKFNPKLGKWKCDYCYSEFTKEEMDKEKAGKKPKKPKKEFDPSAYVSYNCSSCGAEIICDQQVAATFCVYCGNAVVLSNKVSGEFAPDLIIPFKHEKKEAEEKFVSLSKGRPLTPKTFTDKKNVEKIRGVYIPFWLYDFEVKAEMEIDAKKVTTWVVGDTHFTKTDTYNLVRNGVMKYNYIPEDASTRFDNDIMNTIEPFDYNELVPFDSAYLSGFLAERYDEKEESAENLAKKRAEESTKDMLFDTASAYSTKVIKKYVPTSTLVERKYALLPVYMVNVKYDDKQYIFAMNGQTGEFIGNIPIDKKKAVLYFILITVITIIIVIIISFIIYSMGG